MYVESYCLKGACSSPRLLGVVISHLGQGVLEMGQRLGWLGAGRNQPNVCFCFGWESSLFCLEWWGGPGGETPGYLEPCNFPSFQTLRNIYIYMKRERDVGAVNV